MFETREIAKIVDELTMGVGRSALSPRVSKARKDGWQTDDVVDAEHVG